MSKDASPERTWTVPVTVAEIPDAGRHVDLAADAASREAVASLAGVVALPRLEAHFDLTRVGTDDLHVAGRVSATVVQDCVVTLEPVESEIEEAVDLVFTAAPQVPAKFIEASGSKALAETDPPESVQDGVLDLGAVAVEFLILGIDPYPRKPGAEFKAAPAGDPASHPFAALAALQKGRNREEM